MEVKRGPGRPAGARNKNGTKKREVQLRPNSFENKHPEVFLTSSPTGLGSYLELEAILIAAIKKHWTDEKIKQYFKTDKDSNVMEDRCHIYSSSKGRVVIDGGELQDCALFPGIKVSTDFLDHYLHNYDDVANYGEFVHTTALELRKRARELLKKK